MEQITESPLVEETRKEPVVCGRHRKGMPFVLLVLTLLSGFLGGLLSPVVSQYLAPYFPASLMSGNFQTGDMKERGQVRTVVTEDTVVADLVEKSLPGVVSIVISKDVPKLRNTFNNPFGFPFFSPFGTQGQQGTGSTETEKKKIGSGSGFFVSSDGLIVTNKHVVVDEQAEYTVILGDGTEYVAEVLARDPSNDIAVIKVEGKDFPVLTLGDSDIVRVGETVIVIGNPRRI